MIFEYYTIALSMHLSYQFPYRLIFSGKHILCYSITHASYLHFKSHIANPFLGTLPRWRDCGRMNSCKYSSATGDFMKYHSTQRMRWWSAMFEDCRPCCIYQWPPTCRLTAAFTPPGALTVDHSVNVWSLKKRSYIVYK